MNIFVRVLILLAVASPYSLGQAYSAGLFDRDGKLSFEITNHKPETITGYVAWIGAAPGSRGPKVGLLYDAFASATHQPLTTGTTAQKLVTPHVTAAIGTNSPFTVGVVFADGSSAGDEGCVRELLRYRAEMVEFTRTVVSVISEAKRKQISSATVANDLAARVEELRRTKATQSPADGQVFEGSILTLRDTRRADEEKYDRLLTKWMKVLTALESSRPPVSPRPPN